MGFKILSFTKAIKILQISFLFVVIVIIIIITTIIKYYKFSVMFFIFINIFIFNIII